MVEGNQLQLQIGMTLLIDKDFSEDSDKFRSKVIDLGDDYVMIDYPTDVKTGKTAFFMDGTQLFVSFTDKMKMSYAFKTEVSGRILQGVPMLKISYEGDDQLIKVQRRAFVRVETALDVAVEKGSDRVQLVAEDISAGGIALNITKMPILEKEKMISLLLVLPFVNHEIKYVKAKGEIIRTWEDEGRTIASIQFQEIDVQARQQIVRYCFERQLKLRNE